MKKLVKSFVILAVLAIAFGSVSAVYAQGPTSGSTIGYSGTGIGTQSNRGGRLSGSALLYQNRDSFQDGVLYEQMIAAFAEALDMDVEVLETRLADGETLAEISGLPLDEFRALMVEIRTLVHDQAVEDGLLPGSQTGWVNDRSAGMGLYGGMVGTGQGSYGTGICIND